MSHPLHPVEAWNVIHQSMELVDDDEFDELMDELHYVEDHPLVYKEVIRREGEGLFFD